MGCKKTLKVSVTWQAVPHFTSQKAHATAFGNASNECILWMILQWIGTSQDLSSINYVAGTSQLFTDSAHIQGKDWFIGYESYSEWIYF